MIKKPAAAMVVLLFLSACNSAAPTASVTPPAASMPSATAQPNTPSPSQEPHASAPPDAPVVPPGSVAIVIVDELRVRDAPSLSAGVAGRLARSDQVFVTDSPRIQADGLTWMYVQGAWLEDGDGSGGEDKVAS